MGDATMTCDLKYIWTCEAGIRADVYDFGAGHVNADASPNPDYYVYAPPCDDGVETVVWHGVDVVASSREPQPCRLASQVASFPSRPGADCTFVLNEDLLYLVPARDFPVAEGEIEEWLARLRAFVDRTDMSPYLVRYPEGTDGLHAACSTFVWFDE
jgi:hypothetical protein